MCRGVGGPGMSDKRTGSRYRVGRTLGRTIYRDDELIGVMDTIEDAQEVLQGLQLLESMFTCGSPPGDHPLPRQCDPTDVHLPSAPRGDVESSQYAPPPA